MTKRARRLRKKMMGAGFSRNYCNAMIYTMICISRSCQYHGWSEYHHGWDAPAISRLQQEEKKMRRAHDEI